MTWHRGGGRVRANKESPLILFLLGTTQKYVIEFEITFILSQIAKRGHICMSQDEKVV